MLAWPQVLVEKIGVWDGRSRPAVEKKRADPETYPEPVCDFYKSKCVAVWCWEALARGVERLAGPCLTGVAAGRLLGTMAAPSSCAPSLAAGLCFDTNLRTEALLPLF